MGGSSSQSLIALALTAIVVFRFARRELRERTVGARTLWLRPAILLALAGYLISLSARFDPLGDGEMFAVLAGGAVLGVLVGWGSCATAASRRPPFHTRCGSAATA